MKLVHNEIENQFNFTDNINTLVIEDSKTFYSYCLDFYTQVNGEMGKFVLSEGDNIISFSQNVEVVFDFFRLSINDKKFISKLYHHLATLADKKFYIKKAEMISSITNLFEELNCESDFPIDFKEDSGLTEIMKAFNVKLLENYDNLLKKITSYLDAIVNFSVVKLICFVNLKCFLSSKELKELYQYIRYNEIAVFFLENTLRPKIEDEFIVVIDSDLCEIIV